MEIRLRGRGDLSKGLSMEVFVFRNGKRERTTKNVFKNGYRERATKN